uniref:Uncharacterized protein n=1 Tax=Anguilla anguilla TaxID=7936 RepID=A0A0E9SQ32_ANGAN
MYANSVYWHKDSTKACQYSWAQGHHCFKSLFQHISCLHLFRHIGAQQLLTILKCK